MAEIITTQTIQIVAAGLSESIDYTQYVQEYLITSSGAVTLTGNVTITPIAGTPDVGTVCIFKYEAQTTLSTFGISIFGRVINQQEALSKCGITCRWDDINNVWVVDVQMSDNGQYVGKVMSDPSDTPNYLGTKVEGSIEYDSTGKKIRLKGEGSLPASDNTHYGQQGGVEGFYADYVPLFPAGTLIYMAILNQTGTNAPVPTSMINTLGIVVGGTYTSAGVYTLNLPSGSTQNKTFILTGTGLNDSNFIKSNFVTPGGIPKVAINTYDKTGTLADGLLLNMPILILILP